MMRALCLLACIMVTAALTAQPLELSPASDYADSPSMSVANSGDVFVAWIGYDGKGADAVRLRRFTGGMWSEPETVSEKPGDFYKTAVATTPDGRVWIAWAARVDGNVDIYARAWAAGQWSSTTRLTRDPQPDIHHRLLAGADGKLYLCWQSFRTGDGNIYLKVFDGQAWTEPIPITTHEAGDWEPDIAIDAQGRLHIVYDTYRHGDYDVFLRIHDRGNLSPEHPVAATESFEARATVICDRQGRAWVAWDDQGPGWGLDRPLWKQNARQGDWGPPANWAAEDPAGGVSHKVSLRVTQSIGVAVVTQGGRATPVGKLAEALGDPLALTYEIPHLALDADGTPWLFFRRWIARNDGSGMAIRPGGWEIHATHYTGSSWSAPRKLARSAGSNGQRVATVNGPDRKLWIAYPVDDRQAPDTRIEVQAKRHGRVLFTKLDPVRGDEPALAGLEPAASRPFRRTAPPDRRNRIAAGEKRYQLYWGDLHRHTEISDDGGYDGTLWDMYRYAMDVAELDFIASTDHFYGGSGGDERAETYDWWRTQKLADLMHVRGSFLPFFGYERSLRWPYGHRNVINLKRGQPPSTRRSMTGPVNLGTSACRMRWPSGNRFEGRT